MTSAPLVTPPSALGQLRPQTVGFLRQLQLHHVAFQLAGEARPPAWNEEAGGEQSSLHALAQSLSGPGQLRPCWGLWLAGALMGDDLAALSGDPALDAWVMARLEEALETAPKRFSTPGESAGETVPLLRAVHRLREPRGRAPSASPAPQPLKPSMALDLLGAAWLARACAQPGFGASATDGPWGEPRSAGLIEVLLAGSPGIAHALRSPVPSWGRGQFADRHPRRWARWRRQAPVDTAEVAEAATGWLISHISLSCSDTHQLDELWELALALCRCGELLKLSAPQTQRLTDLLSRERAGCDWWGPRPRPGSTGERLVRCVPPEIRAALRRVRRTPESAASGLRDEARARLRHVLESTFDWTLQGWWSELAGAEAELRTLEAHDEAGARAIGRWFAGKGHPNRAEEQIGAVRLRLGGAQQVSTPAQLSEDELRRGARLMFALIQGCDGLLNNTTVCLGLILDHDGGRRTELWRAGPAPSGSVDLPVWLSWMSPAHTPQAHPDIEGPQMLRVWRALVHEAAQLRDPEAAVAARQWLRTYSWRKPEGHFDEAFARDWAAVCALILGLCQADYAAGELVPTHLQKTLIQILARYQGPWSGPAWEAAWARSAETP